MASLLTQSTEENLKILLISETCALSEFLKSFLQEQEIEASYLSPQTFKNLSDFQKFKNLNFYKIIFIYGFSDYDSLLYNKIIEFLKTRDEAKIILTKICSTVKQSEKIFKDWQDKYKDELFFLETCQEQLKDALIITAQDLVESNEKISYPLRFLFSGIKKGILLNPQIDFYLHSDQEFFKAIKNQILKPHESKNILVKGQAVSSTKLCQDLAELYYQYFDQKFKIVKLFAKRKSFDKSTMIICKIEEDINRLLDGKLRLLPALVDELDLLSHLNNQEIFQVTSKLKQVLKPEELDLALSVNKKTGSSRAAKKDILRKDKLKIIKSKAKETISKDKAVDPLDHELKNIFKENRLEEKIERTVSNFQKIKKITKKSKRKKFLFWGGIAFIFLGILPLFLLFTFNFSNYQTKKTLIGLLTDSFLINQVVEQELEKSKFTSFQEKQLGFYQSFLSAEALEESSKIVNISNKIIELGEALKSLNQAKKEMALYVLGRKDGNLNKNFNDISALSKKYYEGLSLLQAEMKEINVESFSLENQKTIEDYQEKVTENKKRAAAFEQLKSILLNVFAGKSKRTYAVLLQNNLELRPTGGFIQAVALITFDQGVLIDSQVLSSYEVDNRLAGFISPPVEIVNFLGEKNFYFRDSNWDPNFINTASHSKWFLKESLGKEVDGVVAVNYFLIRDLIKELGPINIPENNETITDKNLFERLEFHAKDRDYSTLLLKRVIYQIQNAAEDKILILMKIFRDSLDSKQSYLNFSDKNELSVVDNIAWSGAFVDPECPVYFASSNCFIDTFYQVEANVNIKQVNNYIDRETKHIIKLNEQGIVHKRQIKFKNNSRSNLWPLGDYKTYLRFFVPSGAKLAEISFNQSKLSSQEILSYQDKGRQVFGVLIEVPSQEEADLEISYSINKSLEKPFSYLFFSQKQAGLVEKSHPVLLIYPLTLKPSLIAPKAQVNGQVIEFEDDQKTHAFFGVSFE
ncbi:MAG: DUF4012 domain-containing protein [Candidatus Woesebacteria bacterium]|jgi:hypothetical protein